MKIPTIAAISMLCILATGCSTTPFGKSRSAAKVAQPWWREAVFYEIFVRSFADSTSGPLAGDGIGDLRGLIERLDYLNDGDPATTEDLGVTALWLMPIMESPSYHGYDIVDYFAVDSEYGTADDFRELVAECDRRGVRIVLDMVLNHTSDRHPWFAEAREPASDKRGWYIWADERPAGCGDEWAGFWRQSPTGWYYGWFGGHMPDLDYRNPDVTAKMHEASAFWLRDMGAAGLRLDAIRHLVETDCSDRNTPETHAWLKDYHAFCRSVRSDAMLVGEIWDSTEAVAQYGPDELDLAFQFDLAGATLDAVRTRSSSNLRRVQADVSSRIAGGQYATFLTNHDMPRVLTELDGDRTRAATAAAILLTSAGAPFIYYGEEIGMSGGKPDRDIRTPMPWTAAANGGFSTDAPWHRFSDELSAVNVDAQAQDPDSMLSLYRTLIRLRSSHAALRTGTMRLVPCASDAVHSFVREDAGERLLVLVNLSDAEVTDFALDSAAAGVEGGARLSCLHPMRTGATRIEAGGAFQPVPVLAPESFAVFMIAED